jgi:hypothetical protein
MTSLVDKIAELKQEYPTLRKGSDENGYIELDSAEYEATIKQWAEIQMAELEEEKAKALAEQEAKIKRQNALAKLAALGLEPDDLTALGL